MRIRSALAAALLLGLAACGDQGAATAPTSTGTTTGPTAAGPTAAAGLVLRVEYTGGFVSRAATAARLPLISVYADGRVISEGPIIAIYPPPALPNLQEHHIGTGAVRDLVDRALAAGTADTADLGSPQIADATSTRITVVTAEHTYVREAYALTEGATETGGLSAAQQAARAKLGELVGTLTGPTAESGETVAYVPTTMAALAEPWVDPQNGPAQPEVPWPGPALPGEPLAMPGLTCVTATGDQEQAVVSAARSANLATPWVTPDGARWTVTLRPLLPDESSCADLQD